MLHESVGSLDIWMRWSQVSQRVRWTPVYNLWLLLLLWDLLIDLPQLDIYIVGLLGTHGCAKNQQQAIHSDLPTYTTVRSRRSSPKLTTMSTSSEN